MTRARFRERMKKTVINHVGWKPPMVDHAGKGLDIRDLDMRGLDVRGVKEKSLIDRGDTRTNLTMKDLEDKYARILCRIDGKDP
jgi:hypothetical protein